MSLKYIINNGEIIMGNVEFHRELHGSHKDKSKTIGGGKLYWDKEVKKVYFYGVSLDFGAVTKDQFIEAWGISLIPPSIKECEIYFTNGKLTDGEENLILEGKLQVNV